MPRYQIFTAANTATLVVNDSTLLVSGTAMVGTASVIIMNTANWYVNVVNTAGITVNVKPDVMSMTSNNITVYAYSTGIECSATNNLIIAASANRIFKIIGYDLMASVANQVRFQSGSDSTTFVTGTHFFGASGGIVMPYNPMGWFQVTAGSPLYLKLATANSVGGIVNYLVL